MAPVLQTSNGSYVDRPDVVKKAKPKLTFKEVGDCFIKFLMLADVSFTGKEKLPIVTPFVHRRGTPESSTIPISQNYYTVTCRLKDITVDGQPIYIVTIPGQVTKMENRQKNRLVALCNQYNILVFDEVDWKGAGLDISEKKWLKSLGRGALKRLANKLFSKISDLKGEVANKFSLNDVYRSIETNTVSSNRDRVVVRLSKQVLRARTGIRKERLSNKFNIKDSHLPALNAISEMSFESLKWAETIVDEVINTHVKGIDLKRNVYKEFFRRNSGKVTLHDKELLAAFVMAKLKSKHSNLKIVNLGYGALKIQNKKTFQTLTLVFSSSTSKRNNALKLNKSLGDNLLNSLLFNIHIGARTAGSFRPSSISSYAILTKGAKKSYTYNSGDKLPLVSEGKFTLWSDLNHEI